MIIRSISAAATPLSAKRQVRVRCSSAQIDRAGDMIDQSGIDLTSFRKNPVVLFQHDPCRPIARAIELDILGGALVALVQFPPVGVSADADMVLGLVQANVLSTVSIGFNPILAQPIDPQKPRAGQKYLKVDLMELSFVSIPANTDASVLQKSHYRSGRVISAQTDQTLAEIHDNIDAAAHHANAAQTMICALRTGDAGAENQGDGDMNSLEGKAHRLRLAAAMKLRHPPVAFESKCEKSAAEMTHAERRAAADMLRQR